MKANELRIGNYIQWISTGNIDIVSDIVSAKMKHPCINNVNSCDCKPISLTEEWLLKLRSASHIPVKHKEFIEIDRFTLVYQKQYNFWYVYTDSEEELAYITKVEFVHEWQNAYFALNGEELTLTEANENPR